MPPLVIRSEQMKVLRESVQDRVERRMVEYLRDRPHSARAYDELRALIRQAREAGAAHGFHTDWDVCRFAELLLAHGEQQFAEQQQWAADILQQSAWTGSEKIERLYHHHRFTQRAAGQHG